MNFDRGTDGDSPLRWLNIILRGGTEDWRGLYALCLDRAFARQIASLLQQPDPDGMPACRLWLRLLHDLHPQLSEPATTQEAPLLPHPIQKQVLEIS